jgi:hypothetical protein
MTMTLDDLVPPRVTNAVADLGLHKVAGAMLGVPELNLDVALRSLGERAYRRRKEARAIADGVAAYATVTSDKTAFANPALMELLRQAIVPAAAGAGIAALPRLLSNEPQYDAYGQRKSLLPTLGLGALLGTAGSMASNMQRLPHPIGSEVAGALRALP